MKKINLFIGLFFFTSTVAYAQGVKQLWTTTYEDLYPDAAGWIISFDSLGNHFQKRHELPHPPPTYPLWLNFYNGNFYTIVGEGGRIFEYNPLTDQSNLAGHLEGWDISVQVCDEMTLQDGIFYGVSNKTTEDSPYSGYLFTWDPATRVFTRKYLTGEFHAGAMVEKGGKWYGMTYSPDDGSIFEWDPQTNNYTTKINFPEEDKGNPTGSMILVGDKFYGVCSGSSDIAFYGNSPEDPLLTGCLFEWDPATNVFTVKYDFDVPEDGLNPVGNLFEKDGKLYGITYVGGENNAGVIFEFDPAATGNAYSKKADMSDINSAGKRRLLAVSAGNLYGYNYNSFTLFEWNSTTGQLTDKTDQLFSASNALVVAAMVSSPSPGSCVNYPSVQVDQDNNNRWVAITDSKSDVLAELQPRGNNLGFVNAQCYINNTGIRTDGAGRPYLDRSITITPATQPAEGNPVDIRLYITEAELELLKSAPNSGISGISDIGIFKSNDPCSENLINALPVPTTYEDYDFGYILKATVTSFSTFYFSNRSFEVLPLTMLAFSGTLKNDDVLLQWTTEHEYNTSDFDIERSTDGNHFIAVGNVATFNNPGKQEYRFSDQNAGASAYSRLYYRLKQKDLDGKYQYSKTIAVYLPGFKSLMVSPNPAQHYLDITYKGQNTPNGLRLQITDLSGKKVLEQTINPAATVHRINIATLNKGVYLISILNNGKRTTGKFVKQ